MGRHGIIEVMYHWMRDAFNDNLFEINEVTTKGEAWSLLFDRRDGEFLHVIGKGEICWAFPHVEGLT